MRLFLLNLPMAGLEPARGCPHKILSLARLPISSHRQAFLQKSLAKNFSHIDFFAEAKQTNVKLYLFVNKPIIPKTVQITIKIFTFLT